QTERMELSHTRRNRRQRERERERREETYERERERQEKGSVREGERESEREKKKNHNGSRGMSENVAETSVTHVSTFQDDAVGGLLKADLAHPGILVLLSLLLCLLWQLSRRGLRGRGGPE